MHRSIVLWLFFATLVIGTFAGGALLYADLTGTELLSILPVVILAGVLGSFVSALNRIYSSRDIFPIRSYSVFLRGTSTYLIAYSSIPALVGAISSTILYVVFASEIVVGPFFPGFSCKLGEGNCIEFQQFLTSWSPTDAQNHAKAIVWGFVAGFSERFVPDILNKVSRDSEK
ncbi:hypothetical protein [Marinobacterium rhizophilum]|uniref:Uncharacterized protein n=1 Tax=Marinobacterium rhizophilum TaxID=420402 RepID=A0ABY5HDA8_9GAMM|nr:hypothetical protein [Marinobacterium rhizophilum]UTW10255.1 hypothetical protein KDW95_13175 [Marinobacterium rhizophilum]